MIDATIQTVYDAIGRTPPDTANSGIFMVRGGDRALAIVFTERQDENGGARVSAETTAYGMDTTNEHTRRLIVSYLAKLIAALSESDGIETE